MWFGRLNLPPGALLITLPTNLQLPFCLRLRSIIRFQKPVTMYCKMALENTEESSKNLSVRNY